MVNIFVSGENATIIRHDASGTVVFRNGEAGPLVMTQRSIPPPPTDRQFENVRGTDDGSAAFENTAVNSSEVNQTFINIEGQTEGEITNVLHSVFNGRMRDTLVGGNGSMAGAPFYNQSFNSSIINQSYISFNGGMSREASNRILRSVAPGTQVATSPDGNFFFSSGGSQFRNKAMNSCKVRQVYIQIKGQSDDQEADKKY